MIFPQLYLLQYFINFYHLRSIHIPYLAIQNLNNLAHSDIFLLDSALLFWLIVTNLLL